MTTHESPREQPIGWFASNPTYVRIRTEAQKPFLTATAEWSAEPEDSAVKIVWDQNTGQAHVENLPTRIPNPSAAERLSVQLDVANLAMVCHQSVAQRSRNHPSKFGLVTKPLPVANSNQPVVVHGYDGFRRNLVNTAMVPETETSEGMGWFSPNANPEEFGTLFVYAGRAPVTESDEPGTHVYWHLGQIGRQGNPLESVRWDDSNGMQWLRDQVLHADPEDYLAMAALTDDASELRRQRLDYERRTLTDTARELFSRPRDRIKPRLVANAMREAERSMLHEWVTELRGLFYGCETEICSLNTRTIYSNRTELSPVNAAAVTRFAPKDDILARRRRSERHSGNLPASHFDGYARALADRLEKNGLGTILRAYHDGVTEFFVTKNTDLFMTVPAAFGIGSHHQVDQYDPQTCKWSPVVPRTIPHPQTGRPLQLALPCAGR